MPTGGGSTGGLPHQWTVGTDGSLTVTISDAGGVIELDRGSGAGASVQSGVQNVGGGVENATILASGIGGGSGTNVVAANGSAAGTSASLVGNGQLQLFTETGLQGIEAWDDVGNVLRFALLPAGQPMIGVLAAPADAALAAGQVALWFDDTNGAAKLMVKGKSANGTVVAGSLALT